MKSRIKAVVLGTFLIFGLNESSFAQCPPGRACPIHLPGQPGRPLPPRPSLPPVRPPQGMCPPGTVMDPSIQRCVSINFPPIPVPGAGGRMRQVPPSSNEIDEISAANIVNTVMQGLDCSQAAESLRRLSNQLLSMGTASSQPTIPGRPEPDFKRQWRERIRSQAFWSKVWNRMADAYRSCHRGCFDDGLAVGQISATGYCSASVAVDGLLGPGLIVQPPLPVCETAIFVGCLKAYQSTASTFPGCTPYTVNRFQSIFQEYQSQDCHL